MAASPRRFNPLKAYGSVTPPERGAVHYQDGGYFDASGNLVFEDHPGTPDVIVESEVIVSESGAKPIITKIVDVIPAESTEGDPKDILARWLKGEFFLPHLKLVAYFRKAYGEASINKRDEIIAFLVGTAFLVPAELVNPMLMPAAVVPEAPAPAPAPPPSGQLPDPPSTNEAGDPTPVTAPVIAPA